MTHDPRDIETLARMLCLYPDSELWEAWKPPAIRLLDALKAKKWKITSVDTWQYSPSSVYGEPVWRTTHDAAPICPRDQ